MKIRHLLVATALSTLGLALATPAFATHPEATVTVACVEGRSIATFHVTPKDAHGLAVLSGNTYGAFTETFGAVPPEGIDLKTKIEATGQTISLGVQFIFDVEGGRAEVFPLTLTPACGTTPSTNATTTTTAATPVSEATTTTLAATTTTAAAAVVDTTTSTTGVVEATATAVTLPSTGAHTIAQAQMGPFQGWVWFLALLFVGAALVLIARRRRHHLPATVRVR